MSGRSLLIAVSTLLIQLPVALTGPSLAQDESVKPADSAVNKDARPIDLAAHLLVTRARNAELLDQVRTQRISFEFKETPLSDAVARIQAETKIPFILDTLAIEEAGLLIDEPLTIKVENASVGSALDRMLNDLEMTWVVENEHVHLTTVEIANEKLQTRVFAAGDLVSWLRKNAHSKERRDRFGVQELDSLTGSSGSGLAVDRQASSAEILMDLMTDSTEGLWEDLDGSGGVIEYEGGLLTVRQTRSILQQTDRFLKRLRFLINREPSLDMWPITEGGFGLPGNRKVLAALRTSSIVQFVDTPLVDVMDFLSRQQEVQIDLDTMAIEEAGLLIDEPINLVMKGSFHAILRQVLSDLELTWMIRDDTLFITNTHAENEKLFTVVADTRALLASGRFTPERLAETIMIESNGLWEEVDGDGGSVRTIAGLTFVRQTQRVLAEISVLLRDMDSRAKLAESAEGQETGKPVDRLETRFYKAASREKDDVDALMTALTSFVFPDSWETNGGTGVMAEVGSSLVVRQTPKVHNAIAEFISELNSAGKHRAPLPPETKAE